MHTVLIEVEGYYRAFKSPLDDSRHIMVTMAQMTKKPDTVVIMPFTGSSPTDTVKALRQLADEVEKSVQAAETNTFVE